MRMMKSGIAVAVLGAFAGAVCAQSSVTIYGKIDMGIGKPIGTRDKQVFDAGGARTSRLGFRGVEDLGNGWAALFALEHRFNPDDGQSSASTFWNGFSTVGLRGPWGTVNLGRQYTASFTLVQNQVDPFGAETVAALRSIGMQVSPLAKVRIADSIRYDHSIAGVNLAASVAEASQPAPNAGSDRPWSVAANYSVGPFFAAIGYEDPANTNDRLWNFAARYNFGPATAALGFSTGKDGIDRSVRGWLVGATVALGSGDLKTGYATQRTSGIGTMAQKFGLGYHHNLSKRTKLYADVARDGKAATSKVGYDVGMQHNF